MEKPLTIKRQEFIDNLISLVNNSGLPAFVVTPILEEMARKAFELEHIQYQQDKEAWETEETNCQNEA